MDKNISQNSDKQSLPRKTRSNSNTTTEPEAAMPAEPGLLGRVADSATRLASSIARSTAQGGPTFNADSLAEAKSDQQAESSTSMSQEWMAERSKHHTASTSQASAESQLLPGQRDTAATSFRQAMRSNASQSSHQVSLAENLDGQGVVEFLGNRMPTSLSTGGISSIAPLEAVMSPREKDETHESKDPVAYLQSTGYADAVDRRVPQTPRDNPAASQAAMGVSKSWDEHGASILEEWELNEAWDRAWMDTAWKSARKREKESAKPEAVQPTSKNLSYLLKPRI